MAEKKQKNWAFTVYPDSAPDDWIRRIDSMHIQAYISPLHDIDVDEQGKAKKPHYHVAIRLTASTGYHAVMGIFEFLNLKYVEPITSFPSYARYLCHLDNPEKAQYDPEKVTALGGIGNYFQEYIDGNYNKYQVIGEIQDFIRDECAGVISFSELVLFARIHKELNWYNCILDNSYIIRVIIQESCAARSDSIIYNEQEQYEEVTNG